MAQCKLVTLAKIHFLVAIISCGLSPVTGNISAIPKDTEAATGNSVTFQCKSSTSSIEWQHLPYGQGFHEIVYQAGFIFNGYKERFSINRTDNHEYNLVIRNVRSTDAGRYTCIESSDESDQKAAELIVFEQYPSNKSCAAKFICAPVCDAVELTCSTKAYGNIIHSMEWRESANVIVASKSNSDNGITTSVIQLIPNSANGRSYSCGVNYPIHSSLTSQFSWQYTVFDRTVLPASAEQLPGQLDASFTIYVIIFSLNAFMFVAILVLFAIRYFMNKRKTVKHVNSDDFKLKRKQDRSSGEEVERNYLLEPAASFQFEDETDINRGIVPCTPRNLNNSIRGIGVLGNEIFLVTSDGCVVEVFDVKSEIFKRAWMVEGLINPNDIVLCPVKSLVFICDWKKGDEDREIFCCDVNGHLHSRWISEHEKGRISVTKEANLIVAESWYNTITEYTCSGQLIKRFKTGKQTFHLWHAVKLENGNFVASFGDTHDEIQEICVLDDEEKTLYSVNKSTSLPSNIPLSVPISLAVDKDGGIYVCDLYNARIICFTSELIYNGVLDVTEKDERLRGPLRICLYESDTELRLFVADNVKKDGRWSDGRILTWNLNVRSGRGLGNLIQPMASPFFPDGQGFI